MEDELGGPKWNVGRIYDNLKYDLANAWRRTLGFFHLFKIDCERQVRISSSSSPLTALQIELVEQPVAKVGEVFVNAPLV